MEKSNQELVKEIVSSLGKDASAKSVLAKFRETYSDNKTADTTIKQYIGASRKKLGFTKEYIKNKTIVVTPEAIKNAKAIAFSLDIGPEEVLKVLEKIHGQDINLLTESMKFLVSLDA